MQCVVAHCIVLQTCCSDLKSVAVICRVLQCVAVCIVSCCRRVAAIRSVLHWVDICCSVRVTCNVLQTCCSVLQCVLYRVAERVAVTCSDLQSVAECVAVCCSVLYCTAVWCGVSQCVAV